MLAGWLAGDQGISTADLGPARRARGAEIFMRPACGKQMEKSPPACGNAGTPREQLWKKWDLMERAFGNCGEEGKAGLKSRLQAWRSKPQLRTLT